MFLLVVTGAFVNWSIAIANAVGGVPSAPGSSEVRLGPLAFFLVGALTGLVYRLYSDAQVGMDQNLTVSDDSDLTDIPAEIAPLVSGVAAIGGIILTGTVVTLGGSEVGSGIGSGVDRIFAWQTAGQNVIVAAAFGFAPSLLFDRLAQYAGNLKKDLQSSTAAPRTPLPTPPRSA